MKKLAILIMGLMTMPFMVQADVDGHVGYTSDYFFRGVSQTAGHGAVQAGLELDKNGFYVGAWGSQVDFGDDSSYEYDLYGGYSLSISDNAAIDVGVIQYRYDGEGYDMIEEVYAVASYSDLTVGYYKDTDTKGSFMNAKYDISRFVPVVDVSLEYGNFEGGDDYKALNISKDFGKWTIGSQILSGAIDDQFSDSVAVYFNYNI